MFPNNDPVAFMVAFYGCLLAEVVPVPIEVPLSRKVLPLRPLLEFSVPGSLILPSPRSFRHTPFVLLSNVVTPPPCAFIVRQDAGSQQIGFLLGSCGVTVALTSDACHKGLPKSATGEIPQFKGERESHPSA